MAKKDEDKLTMDECIEVADRMVIGFNDAVADTLPAMAGDRTLLVGIRGALSAVRADTKADWIIETLGRSLVGKGVEAKSEEM